MYTPSLSIGGLYRGVPKNGPKSRDVASPRGKGSFAGTDFRNYSHAFNLSAGRGDLHFGFARVRCPECQHEIFVPFSCRQRCLCPGCHQKRTLLSADTIAHTICANVPHRQIVFTIPKRFRIYFRFDRPLLGDMARGAWETVAEVYRSELERDDILLGMVAGIQTFGQLVHWHCHIHVIVSDGGFTSDGTFVCLPRIDTDRLLTVWEDKVFEMLLAADKIDRRVVEEMRSWEFSGFSVDNSVYLSPGDTFGLQRLAQYILRCPFSLAQAKTIHRTVHRGV